MFVEHAAPPVLHPRAMSTLNGFGTFYYGHEDARNDGSFVTTRYLVAAMLPIVPLGTERVVLHGLHDTLTKGRAEYETIEQLPMRWRQVGRTYLKCWLLVPLLLVWPLLLLAGFAGIVHAIAGKETTSSMMNTIAPVWSGVFAIYFIGMLWYLIRRARRTGLRRDADDLAGN
jgi:hypothetical protein